MTACSDNANPETSLAMDVFTAKRLMNLIDGNGVATFDGLPRGEGSIKVCARTTELERLFPGAGIYAVTGSSPFRVERTTPESKCHLLIQKKPLTPPSEVVAFYKFDACTITVSKTNQTTISTTSDRPERFDLSECFYRLSLFVQGFSGAIEMKDFATQDSYSYFAGKRAYVGPVVNEIPRFIASRCQSIKSLYYRPISLDALKKNCPNLFKGFDACQDRAVNIMLLFQQRSISLYLGSLRICGFKLRRMWRCNTAISLIWTGQSLEDSNADMALNYTAREILTHF